MKTFITSLGRLLRRLADQQPREPRKPGQQPVLGSVSLRRTLALPAGRGRSSRSLPLPPCATAYSQARKCVLVLDTSGSMDCDDWEPTRLEGAKQAAEAYCERLANEAPQTEVAIVSFADKGRVCCDLTTVNQRHRWQKAIADLHSGGCTNIRGGLKCALELLRGLDGQSEKPGKPGKPGQPGSGQPGEPGEPGGSRLVLLSDGYNTGRDPRAIADKLKTIAVIDCVGIGGSPDDVDEPLLKAIASEHPDGSKRYRWIGHRQQLVTHFHHLAGRITRA